MTATGANARFYTALGLLGGTYVALILGMIAADALFLLDTPSDRLTDVVRSPEIHYAIKLSLVSCLAAAILSLWVAVPLGYLLSRTRFWGRPIVEIILDIPIVLPPLVIGLSLLILFQTAPGKWVEGLVSRAFGTTVTFGIPAVILAQFAVSCAFAVRTMRVTFDQTSPRTEQVALTLGCTRGQAFWMVALPEAWRGVMSAGTLAWARSLGEFGATITFAGNYPGTTQTMPSKIYTALQSQPDVARTLSMILLLVSVGVLALLRNRWLTRP
jgi:molybdate transport system permease protein